MASDYGDEAGEKLFDWMLRMGQDAGQEAIRASAEKLKGAIRNLRGQIGDDDGKGQGAVKEYARLNLSEFEELPDYASLKEIIDSALDEAAVEHDFVEIGGHDHLVFKVADAPEVDDMFASLEERIDHAADRACEEHERDLARQRDEEPLEHKAEAAKQASKAARDSKDATRQIERVEVKSR